MSISTRQFDVEAATAAVAYMATRLPRLTVHQACKLLYLAEKQHIERYGRLFLKDDFIAMPYGPVPSRVYDLMKAARGEGRHHQVTQEDVDYFAERLVVHGNSIAARCEPDLGELSESAIKCLEDVIMRYGDWDFEARTEVSHDAAWQATWDKWQNGIMSLEDIVHSLPDSAALLAHFSRR